MFLDELAGQTAGENVMQQLPIINKIKRILDFGYFSQNIDGNKLTFDLLINCGFISNLDSCS